uniref:Single-stranded DNA-binding protein 3-like n=1 Tax=Pundamilia nyererei TaxID=303518 RepID=A0A3B4FGW2_9CICH
MFPKGKGTPVPSDSQAREKLALYVYEYLLHIGAQKSAQTFLSEIRWEKNITLGEPPGFLHSWWCVFWDLYCAAPERRETCDHSSEAKAFHDYVSTAYKETVANIAFCSPGEDNKFGPPGPQGSPHPQPPPPNSMMGPHSQVTLPFSLILSFFFTGFAMCSHVARLVLMLTDVSVVGLQEFLFLPCGFRFEADFCLFSQNFGGGMRPPHNTMGPGMPGVNMGPGTGRPWPNPNNMPYSSPSPGAYGLLNLSLFLCYPRLYVYTFSPSDSNNSGDNLYTMINTGPGNRNNFPMGPGSDGPLGAMAGMEPHHMNGSLGSGDMDGMNKNSPNNLSGISNPPGTPRDDGELSGNFLHSFQSENYSPTMTMSV